MTRVTICCRHCGSVGTRLRSELSGFRLLIRDGVVARLGQTVAVAFGARNRRADGGCQSHGRDDAAPAGQCRQLAHRLPAHLVPALIKRAGTVCASICFVVSGEGSWTGARLLRSLPPCTAGLGVFADVPIRRASLSARPCSRCHLTPRFKGVADGTRTARTSANGVR
jgi:hypothetical protein